MRKVGRYTLLEAIGSGGQSEVFQARDEKGQLCAVKIMKIGTTSDPADVARLEREIAIAQRLEHPGIVRVIEVMKDEKSCALAMELLQGESMNQYLHRKGRLTYAELRPILSQLISIFDHCHRSGVIHRDIKPHNVFLQGSGEVKVIDFGISKLTGVASSLTESGFVLGTPYFMAPELFTTTLSDARSDIYSLGILVYKSLTGNYPHQEENLLKLANSKAAMRPPAIRKTQPEIPEWLEKMVFKMMEVQSIKRYQSMADLRIDFESESFFEPKLVSMSERTCMHCQAETARDLAICIHCGYEIKNQIGSAKESLWLTADANPVAVKNLLTSMGFENASFKLEKWGCRLISGVSPEISELIRGQARKFGLSVRSQEKGLQGYIKTFPVFFLLGFGLLPLALHLAYVFGYTFFMLVTAPVATGADTPSLSVILPMIFGFRTVADQVVVTPETLFLVTYFTFTLGGLTRWCLNLRRRLRPPVLKDWRPASSLSQLSLYAFVHEGLRKMKHAENRAWARKVFETYCSLGTNHADLFLRMFRTHLDLLVFRDVAMETMNFHREKNHSHPTMDSLDQLLGVEDSFAQINSQLLRYESLVQDRLRGLRKPSAQADMEGLKQNIKEFEAFVRAYRETEGRAA